MGWTLYETDFYGWTLKQAQRLRSGDFEDLDVANLVEEIEALGRQERRELENRLGILIGHLLKWVYEPAQRSKSWQATIREQRRAIHKLISQSPSLQPHLHALVEETHQAGLDLVVRETGLNYENLPGECPFSVEQVLDTDFPMDLYP